MEKVNRGSRRVQRILKEGESILVSDVKLPQEARTLCEELRKAMKVVEDLAEAVEDEKVEDDLDQLSADVQRVSLGLSKIHAAAQVAMPPRPPSTPSSSSRSLTHFEKMKMPSFDGTVRGYICFKRKFTQWIYNHTDEEIALMRLIDSCVKENSPEWHLIKNKKSVSEAFSALDLRFGRKQSIRDAILSDIRAVPQVKKLNDTKGLRHIATTLLSAREDLKESGIPEECLGDAAFACVMGKLPRLLRRQIDKKIYNDNLDTAEAIDEVIASCTEEANIEEVNELRFVHLDSREAPSLLVDDNDGDLSEYDEEYETLAMGGQGSSSLRRSGFVKKFCVLHPKLNNHSTSECREFIFRKTAGEKRDILKLHELCFLCFESHTSESCKATYTCKEPGCKNPTSHTSCLHPACLENCLLNGVDDLIKPPKSKEERLVMEEILGQHTVRPSHTALVQTSAGDMIEVNVLYDSGSTLSQITQEVARKCGLVPVNSMPCLRIRTAGNTSASNWGQSDLVQVKLFSSKNSPHAVEVNCVSVKYIGETDRAEIGSIPQMLNVETHEILRPVSGPIHILLGNNHSELFPVTLKSEGSAILAQTKFGQIIHGSHPQFHRRHGPGKGNQLTYISVAEGLIVDSVHPDTFLLEKENSETREISAKVASTSIAEISPEGDEASIAQVSQGPEAPLDLFGKPNSECLASESELDVFDKWTKEEDFLVCFRCDACVSKDRHMSKDEERKLKIYKSCITYDEPNKRFSVKMPWTSNFSDLPDNKPNAMKRLRSLTKSLEKNTFLKQKYIEEFEKAIAEGVMVEVSPDEDREWKASGGRVWYVDHFAVINESSESTPVRVVTDPTSAFKGVVINNLFESPPNLIPPIDSMILAFRAQSIPISMDIRRAYRTLWLEAEEAHLHRLLWNKLDTGSDAKTFKMVRNNWGLKPAGALCSIAMQMLAERYRESYPLVYSFVINQVYVDDGAYSVNSVEEALSLARDTCFVLAQGGFEIKYFIIGGLSVDLSDEHRAECNIPDVVKTPKEIERVLGLQWHSTTDELSLCSRVNFSKKRRGARISPDVALEDYDAAFPEVLTLKMYLSVVASLYDVCGLASPASVKLRHELGRIFTLNLSWDDPLPEGSPGETSPSRLRCKDLIKILYGVNQLRFPRCLKPPLVLNPNPVLVIFADSSQMVYGTVAYVNWSVPNERESEHRVSKLVAAKAKPFPKKPPLLTIPRGELLACVLAVRMKANLEKYLPYEFERTIFITDSSIVLGQLATDPCRFKPWVACRVEEVGEKSNLGDWFHIPSKLNMADIVSRGVPTEYLDRKSEWQNGMPFMSEAINKWPIRTGSDFRSSNLSSGTDKELRIQDPRMSCNLLSAAQSNNPTGAVRIDPTDQRSEKDKAILKYLLDSAPNIEMNESSPWYKLVRTVSRIIRVSESLSKWVPILKSVKCQTRSSHSEIPKRVETLTAMSGAEKSKFIKENDSFCPTKREIELSKTFWIMNSQSHFSSEFIKTNRKMNPVLCNDGIWRSFGRTWNSGHTPIIIPADSVLGRVLLRFYHLPGHHGADTTLAKCSEQFWIVNGRKAANEVISKCVVCRKLRKVIPAIPLAPIKLERLSRSEVFSHVMIDFAGPYLVTTSRPNTRANPTLDSKVWVLLILCQASGALHLELAESYDSTDLLASLDNFVHVRGKPQKITADLGSQIVGASGALKSVWACVDKAKMSNFDPMSIEWEFVSSGAHSAIGLVERMVRSFKNSMEAVTSSRMPRLNKLQFSRLLYSIADLINDRPLAIGRTTVAKLDADRLIRPNDLLLGRSASNVYPLVPSAKDCNMNGKSKYLDLVRRNEAFINCFWQKWRTYVFSTLHPVEKGSKSGRPIQVGDVVLIRDTNVVRNHWSIGEVNEIHVSVDGVVRNATVRYKELVEDKNRKKMKLYIPSKSKFVRKSARDLVILMKVDER